MSMAFNCDPRVSNMKICRKLLNYLDEKDLKATFFVVGSRVIERPDVLTEEYMQGHEISVHTWSHHVRGASVRVERNV